MVAMFFNCSALLAFKVDLPVSKYNLSKVNQVVLSACLVALFINSTTCFSVKFAPTLIAAPLANFSIPVAPKS